MTSSKQVLSTLLSNSRHTLSERHHVLQTLNFTLKGLLNFVTNINLFSMQRRTRVSWSDSATPTDPTSSSGQTAPPPLLRRRPSREAAESGGSAKGEEGEDKKKLSPRRHKNTEIGTRSGTETDSTLDSVPEESDTETQDD